MMGELKNLLCKDSNEYGLLAFGPALGKRVRNIGRVSANRKFDGMGILLLLNSSASIGVSYFSPLCAKNIIIS